MPSARERWFAEVLHAALETRVLSEQDILTHATPAVLTAALPRDVMVRVIEATLASGAMSHKAIVDVVTLELLAEKVPPNVVWACLAAGAERSGIRDAIPKDEAPAREFLRRALDSALTTGLLLPKDVVQHVNAQVLGTSLPEALTTKLLEVTLAAGKMTPEIILETLGAESITKHVSTKIVWSCFVKAGEAPATATAAPAAESKRNSTKTVPPPPAPMPLAASARLALEVFDDDVVGIELEETVIEPKLRSDDKAKPLAAAKPARSS